MICFRWFYRIARKFDLLAIVITNWRIKIIHVLRELSNLCKLEIINFSAFIGTLNWVPISHKSWVFCRWSCWSWWNISCIIWLITFVLTRAAVPMILAGWIFWRWSWCNISRIGNFLTIEITYSRIKIICKCREVRSCCLIIRMIDFWTVEIADSFIPMI